MPKGVDELTPRSAAVRQLVGLVKAPRRDHREHKPSEIAKQLLIDAGISVADSVRYMGEIEFDGSATHGLEVNEERPARRVEHVAWVWLAMQHLLGGASPGDRQGHAAQRAVEKLAVGVGECRRLFRPRNELVRLGDSVREVGRDDIEVPQAGMQPLQSSLRSPPAAATEMPPSRSTSRG